MIKKFDLSLGACVYIFSDGFSDQFGGPAHKKFKYEPFKRLMEENSNKPMSEQLSRLENAFQEWIGKGEQTDDICVAGLKKEKLSG